MAMFSHLRNTPEVAVLCYWNSELENLVDYPHRLNSKVELILATGTPDTSYKHAEPLMEKIGFQKGNTEYTNPNTGTNISFWAASPKTVPHKVGALPIPRALSITTFPACCGLGQVIGLAGLNLIIHDFNTKWWATHKIGLLSVIDNGNEQEEKAYAEHGFSPVFFLSTKTIWYRHNSEVVPS